MVSHREEDVDRISFMLGKNTLECIKEPQQPYSDVIIHMDTVH